MKGRNIMMKQLFAGDNPVTEKNYTGTMKTGRKKGSIMKKAIVVLLAILVLPVAARAEDKSKPSPHAAASGASTSSANHILPPDVLVKNVLLPAWRTTFRSEMKTWHKKSAAILEKVTVIEDEKLEPFAEAACAENERAAPPEQNRPQDSYSL
jgi:hypothetical protein